MTNEHHGHEWAKIEAGYAHVTSMVPHADDKQNLMWFGWALRGAFVAGAEWQEAREKNSHAALRAPQLVEVLQRAVNGDPHWRRDAAQLLHLIHGGQHHE